MIQIAPDSVQSLIDLSANKPSQQERASNWFKLATGSTVQQFDSKLVAGKMASFNKNTLVVLLLLGLILCQVGQQVESCRKNRTEIFRRRIENLLLLYPDLAAELLREKPSTTAAPPGGR